MGKENTKGSEDFPGYIRAITVAGYVAFDENNVWGTHPTEPMEAFREAKKYISMYAMRESEDLGCNSPGWKTIRKRVMTGLRILPATPLGYLMAEAFSDEFRRFVIRDMMFDAREEDYEEDRRQNREKIEIDGEPEPIIM